MKLKHAFFFITLINVIFVAPSFSATAQFTAKVLEVLVDDSDYGGCMVRLSQDPATKLAGCGASWVTADCLAGAPTSTKSLANTKLQAAQLAYLTGNNVRVIISDAYTANGKCLLKTIRNQ